MNGSKVRKITNLDTKFIAKSDLVVKILAWNSGQLDSIPVCHREPVIRIKSHRDSFCRAPTSFCVDTTQILPEHARNATVASFTP